MANLNSHRATIPATLKKTAAQVNPFMTPNTSANSAKQGSSQPKNELSPNTEMKELANSLTNTSLNMTFNRQSKQK